MWPNPQEIADLVTFTEKSLIENFIFCAVYVLSFCYFRGLSLREKCPNTELFLTRVFVYSVWIQENTDQKKLRYLDIFHTVY